MDSKVYIIYIILHYSFVFICTYIIELNHDRIQKRFPVLNKSIVGILYAIIPMAIIYSIRILGVGNIPDGRFVLPFIAVIFYGNTSGTIVLALVIITGLIEGYQDIPALILFSTAFFIGGIIAKYIYKRVQKIQFFINAVCGITVFTMVVVYMKMVDIQPEFKDVFMDNFLAIYIALGVLIAVISLAIAHEQELKSKLSLLLETKEELYDKKEELLKKYKETSMLNTELNATKENLRTHIEDITILNKELLTSKEQYQLAVDASQDGFADFDLINDRLEISTQILEILKYTEEDKEEVIQLFKETSINKSILTHEDDVNDFRMAINNILKGETNNDEIILRLRCKDGEFKWISLNMLAVKEEDEVRRIMVAMSDINERYNKERTIKQLAYYDKDINVKNEESFIIENTGSELVISFVLIEQFIALVDTFGSIFKKHFKEEFVIFIRNNIQDVKEIYSIEPNIFTIAFEKDVDENQVLEWLNNLSEANQFIIEYNKLSLVIKYKTITFHSGKYKHEPGDLLKVMKGGFEYCSQNNINENIVYNEKIEKFLDNNYAIQTQLFDVNIVDELSVAFQPQYVGQGEMPVGFEALVRWNNHELGKISPAIFIPMAEKFGLIRAIDQFVWGESFTFIKEYNKKYMQDVCVSINISAMDLIDPMMAEKFIEQIEVYDVPVKNIKLEITETSIIHFVDVIKKNLDTLKNKGLEIYLDDFGTGYSSFNHLINMKVSAIKIDRSFVGKMLENDEVYHIVEGIIELAHNIDVEVVAEGVEELEQYERLDSLGCDKYQGYYFSKPLEKEDIMKEDVI